MPEPMTDEQVTDMLRHAATAATYDEHHQVGRDLRELAHAWRDERAEVERLRGLVATETATVKRWLQRTVELGTRADNAEAACEDLRAQLAEIGETREEFGFTETYPNGTVFTEAECDRDCAERAISRTELPAKLIRRLAGEWREVTE